MAGGTAVALAGCGAATARHRTPQTGVPDPKAVVEHAAGATLAARPATIELQVSSPTTQYTVRGVIDLAHDSYRLRVRGKRTKEPVPGGVLDLIGVRGESYVVQEQGRCWLDPHAPVGRFGAGISVEESVMVTVVTMRLLERAIRGAAVADGKAKNRRVYQVRVDERRASPPPTPASSGSRDDLWVVKPKRLARQLVQPIAATIGKDGRVSRLSMRLPRFVVNQMELVPRPRRIVPEPVAIEVSLGGFGRRLELKQPGCLAIE